PGQYAFDGRMMFIGNLRNLCTESRYMSNATLEAAYGLDGLIGSSSVVACSTEPYISDVPIWMKRSSQSRFISSSASRASAMELVSKKRQECFHDTAPSPCAAKLIITCGFLQSSSSSRRSSSWVT